MHRVIDHIARALGEDEALAEDAEVDITIERVDQIVGLGPSERSWSMIKDEVGQDRMGDVTPLIRHVIDSVRSWPRDLKALNGSEIEDDVHRAQAPLCSISRAQIASDLILEGVADPRYVLKALKLRPLLKMNRRISLDGTLMSLPDFLEALESPGMSSGGGPLYLGLRGTGLTTDHVKAMLSSRSIRRLELLDVSDNEIDGEGIGLLVSWVRRRPKMRALKLSGNPGLEGRDERQIARAYDNQNLLLVDIGGTGHHALINEPTRQITFAGLQADYM